jgi:phosphoglycerol transferase
MNDGHVFLAAYYMIPIGLLVLIRLVSWLSGLSESFLPARKRLFTLQVFAVIAVGSSGAYYGLFFALLSISTLLLVPGRSRHINEIARRTVVVLCVTVGFIAAPIMRNLWARIHGLNSQLTRSPLESVQFGGSISRLYVPWGTWIPHNLRPMVERQEFEWLAVPLLAVLGIWILTVALVRNMVRVKLSPPEQQMSSLIYVFFWALLFFAAGGLSLVFAYGVDSTFRTWNRFGIIIMTTALLAVALLVTQLSRRKWSARASMGVLFAVAFFSQVQPIQSAGIGAEPDEQARSDFRMIQQEVAVINRVLPRNCSILQLPIMAFPEGGTMMGVGNGDHLWIPLVDGNHKYSYGAVKGTSAGDFWISQSPLDAVRSAHRMGFCGVISPLGSDTSLFADIPSAQEVIPLGPRFQLHVLRSS